MSKVGDNTLGRLSEMLFEELERLNALDLNNEYLVDTEIKRAKAIQGVARELNASAETILDTVQLKAEFAGTRVARTPRILGD